MFHISNVDDDKSEWNLNETHIIIPMIEGDVINKDSDKILTSSLTLNSLEAGDQTILTNALEHSFVIGLDKNIFDTPKYKSDLLIIQNSDLKLMSCNSDLKNTVTYTLSYVDQEKSEILWQNPARKDRNCASDKTIFEMKDELNYHEPINELEKNEQINLNDIASHVSRTNGEIFQERITNEEKNEKSKFTRYLTVAENTESVPNFQYLSASKPNENCQAPDDKKLVECNLHFKPNDKGFAYKIGNNAEENIFNMDLQTNSSETETLKLVELIEPKTDEKEEIVNKNKNTKDRLFEGGETYKGVTHSFPEKNLPLKKKAKMKSTLMSYNCENQKSLLKEDVVAANQKISMKSLTGTKTNQLLMSNNFQKDEELSHSDSDTPLINKVKNLRKAKKLKNGFRKFIPGSVISENTLRKFPEEESTKYEISGFNKNKFCNIYDLIEGLRKCRMISTSIWQTLNSGLKEMNVDILEEMNTKKNGRRSLGNTCYSPQLKAFALILYFKQPAAFNYLSQVYDEGWPSLKTIKEWKRRINSHQRPNFIKIKKNIENVKS